MSDAGPSGDAEATPTGVAGSADGDAAHAGSSGAGQAASESTGVLAEGLAALQALVRADGSDLVLTGSDRSTGRVELRLVIEDADCADCVMPRDLIEGVALDRLRGAAPWVTAVAIDDPRAS